MECGTNCQFTETITKLADGTCIRDYVHVNDLADGHVRALDYISKKNTSLVVNLGSEHGISVKVDG